MKKINRAKKHLKVRSRIIGTSNRPRLAVYRSGKHIYAQLVDDSKGATVIAESDLKIAKSTKSDKAFQVGKSLAEKALKLKIKEVVFDRGGFLYHGRVAKLAGGVREGGLKL